MFCTDTVGDSSMHSYMGTLTLFCLHTLVVQAQSLSHRVQASVSSLYKVRDWNIDHDRFSEAKRLDAVAAEFAAMADMVSDARRQQYSVFVCSTLRPVFFRAFVARKQLWLFMQIGSGTLRKGNPSRKIFKTPLSVLSSCWSLFAVVVFTCTNDQLTDGPSAKLKRRQSAKLSVFK